jgi:hypothetical protein
MLEFPVPACTCRITPMIETDRPAKFTECGNCVAREDRDFAEATLAVVMSISFHLMIRTVGVRQAGTGNLYMCVKCCQVSLDFLFLGSGSLDPNKLIPIYLVAGHT